jgi:hypothetical protein
MWWLFVLCGFCICVLRDISAFNFKGILFYHRPNSLLLVIEPVQFADFNTFRQFWGGMNGEYGLIRPKSKALMYICGVCCRRDTEPGA